MKHMTIRSALLAAAVALLTATTTARQASSPEELLGRALHEEQIEGNCAAAIATYKMVVEHAGATPGTTSRALLQLAGCYEKLGRPEARATYQRVLSQAPAGSPAHAAARAKVAPQNAPGDPLAGRNIDAYFKDARLITPSAEGTLVAYAKAKPGRSTLISGESTPITALHVRDLSNGQERLLFDPGDKLEIISRIAWSPDASQIAYLVQLDSTTHPVKDGWAFDLHIATLRSGESRTVVRAQPGRPFFIQWSPDSSALAFETPNTSTQKRHLTVWTRSDDTTRVLATMRKLPNAPPETVSWSPDSTRLAFIPEEGTAVAIVAKKGGNPAPLSVPTLPAGQPLRLGAWNINGEIVVSHLAPQVGWTYYMVPTDGRPFRKVCEGRAAAGGDGCQPPDAFNNFVVVRRYTTEAGRSFLRDLATGTERALTDSSVFELPILRPSRNGKLIAFLSNRDGDFGVYVAPVDRLPVKNPVRVARLDSATDTASGWWTRDGLVLNMTGSDANIFRVNIGPSTGKPTGPAQRLTQDSADNSAPALSPDGKQILYRVRDRREGVAIMDANGANERIVSTVPSHALLTIAGVLGWRSPTEAVLHPGNTRATGKANISLLNLQNGTRQPLAQPDLRGYALRYVARTDEIVYVSEAPAAAEHIEVRARSVKSGADRLIAKTPSRHIVFTHVNDEMTRVFYTTVDETPGDGKPLPTALRMIDLKTGNDTVLIAFDAPKGPWDVWPVSTHGRHLLYQDDQKATRIMDIESGQSWPLLTEPVPGIGPNLSHAQWAPDGSFIVFTGWSQTTERRMWTGLTYERVVRLTEQRR